MLLTNGMRTNAIYISERGGGVIKV
jgi:hypothetical protein